jgi:predicted anti-sigma-YlaC factor YlaD
MSRSMEEPQRSALRNFARWLLIAVPLVTIGLATGDGTAVVLGAAALYVAGRYIGLRIELWRYFSR